MPQSEAQNVAGFADLLTGIGPLRDVIDRWCWLPDSTRGFSVKSCYECLCLNFVGNDSQVDNDRMEPCKKIWRNDVLSKATIFKWRLLLEKIATREGF